MSGHASPLERDKICKDDSNISLYSYVGKTNNSEKTSTKIKFIKFFKFYYKYFSLRFI
jgi:hypothetical protein